MAKGKGGGYKTASGPIVSINDALAAPLRSLRVGIDPVQAGTGDPSPDNVRPISGWSAANVWRTGKNLFPDAGDITVVSNKSFKYNSPIIFKGQTVTLSFSDITYSGGFTSSVVFFIRANNAGITNLSFNTSTKSKTWTATEDVYGLNFYATSSGATNPGVTTVYHDAQLELSSTATTYAPYTGNQYTIQLGQTIYGATLDVTNGVLTVRPYYGSYNGEPLVGPWISSMDAYAPGATPTTGAQVVDLGGTPIEIPLTATQISLLAGQNALWADSGDVTVEYLSSGGTDPDLMKLAVAFMGR